MVLQWTELNELGQSVKRNSLEINLDNVKSYAKRNCRKCFGRGYENVDRGSNKLYRVTFDEKIMSCQCVDNHLAKLDRMKCQK